MHISTLVFVHLCRRLRLLERNLAFPVSWHASHKAVHNCHALCRGGRSQLRATTFPEKVSHGQAHLQAPEVDAQALSRALAERIERDSRTLGELALVVGKEASMIKTGGMSAGWTRNGEEMI